MLSKQPGFRLIYSAMRSPELLVHRFQKHICLDGPEPPQLDGG
jgi:hypothetical protein